VLSDDSGCQARILLGNGQDHPAAEIIVTDASRALRSDRQAPVVAPQSAPFRLKARAEWLSRLAWAIGAVACLILSAHVISKAPYSGADSWFPMTRALGFLHGSQQGLVYQTLFFADHIKFQYPLTSLLPLDLLNWLGVATTTQFNAINAIVLIVTGIMFAVFSVKMLGPIYVARIRLPIAPLAFLITLEYFPEHLGFLLGQLQILLDLLFLLACLALLYDRRLLAGCLIGASALVKPQFVLFGALALWRRNWRFIIGFAAITSLCLLLSLALYGWRNELDYLPVLTFLSHHGEWEHMNQSVNGVLVRFLYHGPSLDLDPHGFILQSAFPPYIPLVYYATIFTSLAMMAIPFLTPARSDDVLSKLLQFCTASILFTMASPIAWTHHYGILLPAYVVALKAIWERGTIRNTWISLTCLGISFLLTGLALDLVKAHGRPVGPTVPALNIPQSHVFVGACILVGVLLVEQRFRSRSGAMSRTISPGAVA
jgi:alpha-1,2-mannosyltransferase